MEEGMKIKASLSFPHIQLGSIEIKDNDALIELTAPAVSGQSASAGADIMLVLDVSGSMDGAPLETLKSAVKAAVEKLGENDRLGIVTFSSRAQLLFGLTPRDKLQAVGVILATLTANGATYMVPALEMAKKQFEQGSSRTRMILAMTDGHVMDFDNSPARQAAGYDKIKAGMVAAGIMLNGIGFGAGWDQDFIINHLDCDGVQHYADPAGGNWKAAEDYLVGLFEGLFSRSSNAAVRGVRMDIKTFLGTQLVKGYLYNGDEEMSFLSEIPGQPGCYFLGNFVSGETKKIVMKLRHTGGNVEGVKNIARLNIGYEDLEGAPHTESAFLAVNVTSNSMLGTTKNYAVLDKSRLSEINGEMVRVSMICEDCITKKKNIPKDELARRLEDCALIVSDLNRSPDEKDRIMDNIKRLSDGMKLGADPSFFKAVTKSSQGAK